MPYVSGHYRDGRWVRPHYRRSTPRTLQGTGQVRVRAHRRADGTKVRSHYRTVDPPTTPAASSGSAGSDFWSVVGGLLLLILIIAAVSQA